MNAGPYSTLKHNVSMLGQMLGQTISEAEGAEFLDKIEAIRLLSKSARAGNSSDENSLKQVLRELPPEQLLPVSRAFHQFLNLANIADQQLTLSRQMVHQYSSTKTLAGVFDYLQTRNTSRAEIAQAVRDLKIELVLTAHPTEITRRTLIDKYGEINHCLGQLELNGLTEREQGRHLRAATGSNRPDMAYRRFQVGAANAGR